MEFKKLSSKRLAQGIIERIKAIHKQRHKYKKKLKRPTMKMPEPIPPEATPVPHHWKLRDKDKKNFLTKADIDPMCPDDQDDVETSFSTDKEAHDARYEYERAFERVGCCVSVEVVAFSASGKELYVE